MDPITIIIGLKLIALVVALFLLTYQLVLDWFQQNEELVASDIDNIGVTLKELYQTGNYKIVQGVFNKRTNQVVTGRKIHAQKIDQSLDEKHRNQELIIYPQ